MQKGIAPQRVVRLTAGGDGQPTGVEVLLAGRNAMTDLSLRQVVGNRFHFVANSGWSPHSDARATPAPRNVTALSTPF